MRLRRPAPLHCRPRALEIHIARTAQIYHIVDQLSAWDRFAHPQYRKHFPRNARDKRVLLEHGGCAGS